MSLLYEHLANDGFDAVRYPDPEKMSTLLEPAIQSCDGHGVEIWQFDNSERKDPLLSVIRRGQIALAMKTHENIPLQTVIETIRQEVPRVEQPRAVKFSQIHDRASDEGEHYFYATLHPKDLKAVLGERRKILAAIQKATNLPDSALNPNLHVELTLGYAPKETDERVIKRVTRLLQNHVDLSDRVQCSQMVFSPDPSLELPTTYPNSSLKALQDLMFRSTVEA